MKSSCWQPYSRENQCCPVHMTHDSTMTTTATVLCNRSREWFRQQASGPLYVKGARFSGEHFSGNRLIKLRVSFIALAVSQFHCTGSELDQKPLFQVVKNEGIPIFSTPWTYMPVEQGPWWRHQVETFSALLAICAGNSPLHGEFPAQRQVTRGFDIFFDLRLNKRLSKQSWGWWFDTLSCPLWRHCNAMATLPYSYYLCEVCEEKFPGLLVTVSCRKGPQSFQERLSELLCNKHRFQMVHVYPDSKVYGANMGPTLGRQDPGGSHVGPVNLAICVESQTE